MGKFANNEEGVGARLAPPPQTDDNDGFNAMGKPVSNHRRAVAYEHLKDIGVVKPVDRWDCVQKMAEAVERDEPHRALEDALEYIDATGAYRILAVLCTA